jgi:predicted nucleic acid-binding protein
MVSVDTSVWIRALANQSPYQHQLDQLLSLNQVAGHELVYGELLIEDTGGRRKVLDIYDLFPKATSVPHSEVVTLVRARHLCGRGVGWIDMHLLASAIVDGMQLWTADLRLTVVAQDLKMAYSLSGD